jgi:hypothetical protein
LTLNPKSETNPKLEPPNNLNSISPRLEFLFWPFEFVSDFVLRASEFKDKLSDYFHLKLKNIPAQIFILFNGRQFVPNVIGINRAFLFRPVRGLKRQIIQKSFHNGMQPAGPDIFRP